LGCRHYPGRPEASGIDTIVVMQEHDPARTLVFHPSRRSVVYFGPFRLDLSDGLLSRGGEEVRLPPRALAILQHLVERAGRIVSKHTLMDVAWKDAHVSEASLTEAVGLIRQALGDDPQQPEFIQTVHRRGYRFIAPIATDVPSSTPPDRSEPAEEPSPANDAATGRTPASSRMRRVTIAGLVGAAVLFTFAGLWAWMARRPAASDRSVRVNIAFPSEQAPVPSLNAHPVVALSPDGERFVYVGGAPGNVRLFLREMNRFDAMPLPGTDGAHGPFFSPDGEWVAFFAQGSLKKVRATKDDGLEPQVICAAETGVGGAWVSATEIVFAPNWSGPLMRVPASGGRPAVAVALPAGTTYRWPDRLDDQTILATRWRSSADDAAVVAISLSSGAERVIAEPATFGRYAASGNVVFLRDGDLYSVRVDPSTHHPQGTPVRVVPAVMTGMTGAAQFAISPRGSLLYIDDVPERSQRTLARVDGQGRAADLPIPPRAFRHLAVCGDRLAATVFARGQTDLWTGRLDRAAMTQITREGTAFEPVWSPDCKSIAFSWNRTGVANIYAVAIESGEAPKVLFESPFSSAPGSWSADGRWLAYTERHPETSADIWLWDRVTGHRRPVIATPGLELLPTLSPDGTYLAYESSATGVFEVEVASTQSGARAQISVGGGAWPAWSADGRQLFFLHDSSIMQAGVAWHDGQVVGTNPVSHFSHPDIILFERSGDQLVWLRRTAGAVPLTRMNLVLNWFSELDRNLR
jgi:DNA-binding winged helix-turn-helix (wHTH) protein/Tol biopolymer transport system component